MDNEVIVDTMFTHHAVLPHCQMEGGLFHHLLIIRQHSEAHLTLGDLIRHVDPDHSIRLVCLLTLPKENEANVKPNAL